jgi:hypothetical protein
MSAKITYYLPKKILKISFPLTIVEKKTTYNSGRSEVSPVESYIRGDIKVMPLLIPDEQRGKFIYSPAGISFLMKNTLAVEYDGEGAGLLLSLNTAQTNLVGDVISAAINVAASVVSAGALLPAAMATPSADPVTSVDYSERQLDIVQLVVPGRGKTIPLVLPDLPNNPRISIAFRDNPGTVYSETASGASPVGNTSSGASPGNDTSSAVSPAGDKKNIWYLVARPMIVAVIVENNAYIPRQTVAEEIIYFPQFGELTPIEIVRKSWWFFGAINTSLNFSPSTGSLQKFCITTESNVKDLLADAQKGTDARNTYRGNQQKTGAGNKKRRFRNEA